MLALLITVSIVMQQILSLLGDVISALGDPTLIIISCMLFLLTADTVLVNLPYTIIFAPIAYTIGVDPINFTVIFLVDDAIGFITPLYGLIFYVTSGISGIPYFQIVKHVLPYLFALIAA